MKRGLFRAWHWMVLLFILVSLGIAVLLQTSKWPGEQGLPASEADVIVVLGGNTEERSAIALDLYRKGAAQKLIVSGDNGGILKRLRDAGVGDNAMIHEAKSRSTWENGLFCKPIIERLEAKNVILVTSWYHAGRARAVFAHLLPDCHFTLACGDMPDLVGPEDRGHLRRERVAMSVYVLKHGVPPF